VADGIEVEATGSTGIGDVGTDGVAAAA